MARRGYLVLAHLACRTPLSVSLSPIPATKDCRLWQVRAVFFPVTTGICRQLSALPGLDRLSSLFRDTGLLRCAVYFLLLAPSSKVRAYRHDTHEWNLLWKGTLAMFLSSTMEFVLV